ncbi:uncharacterized protein A4U43_C01F15010 [Asparagus officinalis]|uniref:Methyltransferase type 11 domain-containing protein n=1 Tax=Asparagus officinalis TaxID=4686 RepID=A0A5P1FU11_ASPOF|nr:uncharacterized protein A4U43_C01F15010 [Asparagus officinalis]
MCPPRRGGIDRVDFGTGASGDFAAVMADRNVTIMSASSLSDDVDGVLSRGVFPLVMSSAMRFPFYDGIFDLVHTTKGLDEGGAEGMGLGKAEAMEFLMFDIDRVLRAGGFFWLDNYLCVDDERKRTVTRLIERFGYKKLKWVVGEKADSSGKGKAQVYLSAVLQKPARG